MDPASEELERRSRYLSSLIRRTKLSAAPAHLLPPVPEPEPQVAPVPEAGAGAGKLPLPVPGEAEPAVAEKEKREVKVKEEPTVEREVREGRVVVGPAEKEKKQEVMKGGGDGKGKQGDEPRKASVRVVVGPADKEKKKQEVMKGGGDGKGKQDDEPRKAPVRVRAADMPLPLQRRAIRLAYEAIAAMPRLDSKRLALALKKVCTSTRRRSQSI
jgi:dynein light chain LC8-type